jgi:NitT/TauT family transport system substrate-binding protein
MRKVRILSLLSCLLWLATPLYAQPRRIPVAYSAISATQTAFYIAKEGGYFERNGLFVDPVYVASGTKVAQAVIAGEFPLALAGGVIVSADLGGGDIAIIGGVVNVPAFSVFVDASIKKPEDLKGKAIGITRYGSSTDFSVRYLVKKWGMEPDRDIKILQMGGQPEIFAGLQAGAIQGGVLSSPGDYKAKRAGFRLLTDFKKVGLDYPTVSLVSARSFIKNDPQTVKRFLMAYSEATERFFRDKEYAMRVLGKYTRTEDREVLAYAYAYATTFIERPPHLPYKAVETVLTQLAAKDPRAKAHKASDFIDPTFYNELEKDGFFKGLAR